MSKTANITEFLNSKKVELSSDVVELGVIEDIKKELQNVTSLSSEFDKVTLDFVKIRDIAKKLSSESQKSEKQLEKLSSEFEKKSKELGIEPNTSIYYQMLAENYSIISKINFKLKEFNLI